MSQGSQGQNVLLKHSFLCVPSSATFVNVPTIYEPEMQWRLGRKKVTKYAIIKVLLLIYEEIKVANLTAKGDISFSTCEKGKYSMKIY